MTPAAGGAARGADGTGPVDAHVHVASDDVVGYPRHPTGMASDWWQRGGYEVGDVLGVLAAAGVSRMIAVQAAGAYDDDNRYVVDSAERYPGSVRAVVVADPDAAGAADAVAEAAARPGVCGVRYMAVRSTSTWVGSERAEAAFESAGRACLTVVLTVFSAQLRALRPVMERFPDVPVVLDHCAFPTLDGPLIGRHDPLFALADLPRVALKITTHNLAPLPGPGGGRPLLEQLVGRFGADRVLWGSDYPQSAHRSYAALVDLAREAVSGLAPDEQAAVLGGNAMRYFAFRSVEPRPAPGADPGSRSPGGHG